MVEGDINFARIDLRKYILLFSKSLSINSISTALEDYILLIALTKAQSLRYQPLCGRVCNWALVRAILLRLARMAAAAR